MKNAFPILLMVILLMVACGRPSGNALLSAELQRAEDLMYPHPDSALHILQAMTPPKDELNRATWALLLTQAKYKCFVDQSDSLVNIAHDYFMKGDNAQRKALALYHKAVLLKEKNEVDKALPYYLQASEEVKLTEDYRLAYLIHSHVGRIYAYRKLYSYSLSCYHEAIQYAELSKNPFYIGDSFLEAAKGYAIKKEYDEALKYYDKAIEVGNIYGENKISLIALREKAGIYSRQKKYDEALKIIQEINPSLLDAPGCQMLGNLYYQINQLDSALYYFNKATDSNIIYTLRSAYQGLYYASEKKGEFEQAVKYSRKYWTYQDSINKIDRNKALIEMQEKYDQQRVKDEMTAKMTLQKQRIMMGIGVAILILCFIAYRIRIRNKERITRLAEAEERIETLNHLLEEAQKEPSPDAGQDDTFFKRILLQQLGIIRMVANTPTAQNQALLRRLAETGNDEMPAEELIAWKDLYPIIDRLYHGFYTRLTQHFGSVLTDKEVQTCCLLCAGFSTKEIAVITRQAVNTVYIRKSSSRQKMGMPEGADIVEWVKNFSLKSV